MATKVLRTLSMAEIRGVLSEEVEKIRTGKATAANVNAISNATGKILSSIKLELEYHKLVGKTPNIAGMLSQSDEGEEKR